MMSGLSIVSALTLLGGTAYAAFFSQNTYQGNAFAAGTMSLVINAQAPTSTGQLSMTGAAPGEGDSALLDLTMAGDVDASSVQVSAVNIGGANADLANYITLTFFNDANGSGVLDGGETILGSAHLNDGVWTGYTLPGVTVPTAGNYKLGAQAVLDAGTPNTEQGKSLVFDIVFQANQ